MIQAIGVNEEIRKLVGKLPARQRAVATDLHHDENRQAHENYGAPLWVSPDDAFAVVGAIVELASRQLRTGHPEDIRDLEPVIERMVNGLVNGTHRQ